MRGSGFPLVFGSAGRSRLLCSGERRESPTTTITSRVVVILQIRMSDDESTKVTITLRTIVTGPEAGCIIGRGGEIVNSIRDESGAKIKIEGSSQQERIITVDGPTDSIFKVPEA